MIVDDSWGESTIIDYHAPFDQGLKFCFNFSRVLDGVVDCVSVKPSARARLNKCLRDAQKVCALTKVGTVLKRLNAFSNETYEKLALPG